MEALGNHGDTRQLIGIRISRTNVKKHTDPAVMEGGSESWNAATHHEKQAKLKEKRVRGNDGRHGELWSSWTA